MEIKFCGQKIIDLERTAIFLPAKPIGVYVASMRKLVRNARIVGFRERSVLWTHVAHLKSREYDRINLKYFQF